MMKCQTLIKKIAIKLKEFLAPSPYSLAPLLLLLAAPAHAAWQPANAVTAQEIASARIAPENGVSIQTNTPYFTITAENIASAVAEQLQQQAIEKKAEVKLSAGINPILYSADHPLKLVIHALQVDPQSHRWQAQANILANGKTETVKPVSGTYSGLVDVPVLTRQLGRNDVIEAGDLATRSIPAPQLRKETVTDTASLIGLSPRNVITTNRPIRQNEVSSPLLIKKGQAVQMTFTNPYMSIKTTGVAMQDGAKGDMIRVKNDKSEKAVSGRVQGAGHVEVSQ